MAGSSSLIVPLASPPDFSICDSLFARGLGPRDCFLASNSPLTAGELPAPFYLDPSIGQLHKLPFVMIHGGCQISVEAAGQYLPKSMVIIPNDIRKLALSITRRCVSGLGGVGGFATLGFRGLVAYTMNPLSDLIGPYPTSAAFVTIAITHRGTELLSPGQYDPSIPLALANSAQIQSQLLAGGRAKEFCRNNMRIWKAQAELMKRSTGTTPWWPNINPPMDEMTYECDVNLGSPIDAECSRIEMDGSGSLSRTLETGPEEIRFLYSNTCFVAISAAIPVTISWVQIQAALETLRNFCLTRPFQPAQGGRAYHIPQGLMNKRVGKRQSQVTGLNALPPHVNLTLFQQIEAWIDQAAEIDSCTWKEVTSRRTVKVCV